MEKLLETDLYGLVKALFEARGFEVKGEIGASDVVAARADDDLSFPPKLVPRILLKLS